MIIITQYSKINKSKEVFHDKQVVVYIIKSQEKSTCPICGGCFCVIGVRRRQMICATGELEILIIRRLRCTKEKCHKIHHELPDCLYPFKRHCAETIEAVIKGKENTTPCGIDEAKRLKKWWFLMLPYFMSILFSLNLKYETCFDHNTTPREVVRAVVNSHSWVHTRSLVTRTNSSANIPPSPTAYCRPDAVG